MNLKIKVETQGTEGAKNTLTQDEIDNAKGVILAVGGQAVLGRQNISPTRWLTERHGYDPTYLMQGLLPLHYLFHLVLECF